jgi:hypothetical protein
MPASGDLQATVLRGEREVAEDEAGAGVAASYARLREALGTPFVPTVFRMLAVHEGYLEAVVDAVCATPAERRRSYAQRCLEAAAEVARQLEPEGLDAGEHTAAIRALIARYNLTNPKGLLVLAALSTGLDRADGVLEAPLPPRSGRPLEADILACHGGFTVPGFWRELSHGWPELAERAWTEVRTLAASPRFAAGRTQVLDLAAEALPPERFPRPDAAIRDAEAARDVARIVSWFARAIPTMMLEIECLRLAVDAGRARSERA